MGCHLCSPLLPLKGTICHQSCKGVQYYQTGDQQYLNWIRIAMQTRYLIPSVSQGIAWHANYITDIFERFTHPFALDYLVQSLYGGNWPTKHVWLLIVCICTSGYDNWIRLVKGIQHPTCLVCFNLEPRLYEIEIQFLSFNNSLSPTYIGVVNIVQH